MVADCRWQANAGFCPAGFAGVIGTPIWDYAVDVEVRTTQLTSQEVKDSDRIALACSSSCFVALRYLSGSTPPGWSREDGNSLDEYLAEQQHSRGCVVFHVS